MTFIYIAVALAVGFGLGWYVKGRGVAGVVSDAKDAKSEIEKRVG